jgi:hypothetical protein
VLERGHGMVLAAHHTAVGRGLVTQTVETVAFTRPDAVDFRLVRGPVPHVRERFSLTNDGGHTRLEYTGEMGTDGWALGAGWAAVVARRWEATVADSLATVKSRPNAGTHCGAQRPPGTAPARPPRTPPPARRNDHPAVGRHHAAHQCPSGRRVAGTTRLRIVAQRVRLPAGSSVVAVRPCVGVARLPGST